MIKKAPEAPRTKTIRLAGMVFPLTRGNCALIHDAMSGKGWQVLSDMITDIKDADVINALGCIKTGKPVTLEAINQAAASWCLCTDLLGLKHDVEQIEQEFRDEERREAASDAAPGR